MKEYTMKVFMSTINNFNNQTVLVTNKSVSEIKEILEKKLKSYTQYNKNESVENNENSMTYNWMNYGMPDFCFLDYVTAEFKGVDRRNFIKIGNDSNVNFKIPRITLKKVKATESKAIAIEHVSAFSSPKTVFDIRTPNGMYKTYNNVIQFGVYVIFCF